MAVWEYKTVVRNNGEALGDEDLNKFGAQGFELMQVAVSTEIVTSVGRQDQRVRLHYFFKRLKAVQGSAPKPPAAQA